MAGHATDDDIIRRMRLASWLNKATDTHSEYVRSSTATVVNANAPHCYVCAYIACRFLFNFNCNLKKRSIKVLFN